MYLTYDEYINMGGTISDASFSRFEHKARALIDLKTYGRVQHDNPVRDAVKYACFDLIQAMNSDECATGSAGLAVSSMSNDGISVTYAGAVSAGSRYNAIIRDYLIAETNECGVPLMYAGVDA